MDPRPAVALETFLASLPNLAHSRGWARLPRPWTGPRDSSETMGQKEATDQLFGKNADLCERYRLAKYGIQTLSGVSTNRSAGF